MGQRNLHVSAEEFERMFNSVKTWGQWGEADQRGCLNYITSQQVTDAASLVRSGTSVSLALPLNTIAGPDNPKPVSHFMTLLADADIGSGALRLACDYMGMEFHGDAHSHIDALCHVIYKGKLHNGASADNVLSTGTQVQSIDVAAGGIVSRGVLIDIPRLRGIPWVEPGESIFTDEIIAAAWSKEPGMPRCPRPACTPPSCSCSTTGALPRLAPTATAMRSRTTATRLSTRFTFSA
jgi:hypothetical protein